MKWSILFVLLAGTTQAEVRTWVCGKHSARATLLGVTRGIAALKVEDGQTVGIATNKLSADDQAYIRQWLRDYHGWPGPSYKPGPSYEQLARRAARAKAARYRILSRDYSLRESRARQQDAVNRSWRPYVSSLLRVPPAPRPRRCPTND